MGLPRCRAGQIIPAHHLVDITGSVVDDHREVVGEDTVATLEHQIIDRSSDGAKEFVDNSALTIVGPQTQGRIAPCGMKSLALPSSFALVEVATCARIRPRWGMGRRGGLPNVFARAIAFVDEPLILQTTKRPVVDFEPFGLDERRLVGNDPEFREDLELRLCSTGPDSVQVLDAPQESSPCLPGTNVGQQS